jgi:glycosyltransferase 2 family protein
VPLAVLAEQLVRAWKWHQLLYPLRSVDPLRLFGATMAGYLIATAIPFGVGAVARAWLVSRREGLELPAVLGSIALDGLTDGIAFACLVPVALLSATFAHASGSVHTGLLWGGQPHPFRPSDDGAHRLSAGAAARVR